MTSVATPWIESNQRYLMAAVGAVRDALRRQVAREAGGSGLSRSDSGSSEKTTLWAAGPPPALDAVVTAFGRSPFERDVLVLCAAIDLDASFATLCAEAQGDPRRGYPTFSLALAALPHAHWSALAPDAPLRYWRMIELGGGDSLTSCPLRIDERI